MTRMLLAALLSLTAFAAQADQGTAAVRPQEWQLAEVDGSAPGWTATLNLSEPGKVSGQAPCNRYFGPVTWDADRFQVGNLAATRMACLHMQGEDVFFSLLQAMETSQLMPDALILSGAGHQMRFVPLGE